MHTIYIIKTLCYGMDVTKDKRIQKIIDDLPDPYEFQGTDDNGDLYAGSTYHGSSNHIPFVIGLQIASDKDNKSFLQAMKDMITKKEEHQNIYQNFEIEYLDYLYSEIVRMETNPEEGEDLEFIEDMKYFIHWLENTLADYYIFESSS